MDLAKIKARWSAVHSTVWHVSPRGVVTGQFAGKTGRILKSDRLAIAHALEDVEVLIMEVEQHRETLRETITGMHEVDQEKDAVLEAIANRALTWWTNRRPLRWTVDQHLKQPIINTRNRVEAALAEAVATFVRKKNQ